MALAKHCGGTFGYECLIWGGGGWAWGGKEDARDGHRIIPRMGN